MAQTHLTTPQGVQPPTTIYAHRDGWQGHPASAKNPDMLLIYIVDYCEKRGFKDSSATLRRESKLPDGAKAPVDTREGLLFEWWTCFWEVYQARLHPNNAGLPVAKDYAEILPRFQQLGYREPGQLAHLPNQGPIPGRPYPNGTATVVVNGQPPTVQYPSTLPPGMNSAQGMPGITPDGSGPSASFAQNPNLQHLQGGRIGPGGRAFPPPGIPAMGPMGPYPPQLPGPSQARMVPPNAPQSGNTPQPRPPQPGQHANSPQNGDNQAMGTNSSPRQSATTDISDIPLPRLQEYAQQLGLPPADLGRLSEENKARIREIHDQKAPKAKNSRGQKRPSPGGEEVLPKGESPPDRKKPRRSPQETGAPLPSTPSLPAQPVNGRPPLNGTGSGVPTPVRAATGPQPVPTNNSIPLSMQQPPLGTIPGAPVYNNMPPGQLAQQFRDLQQVHTQRHQQGPSHPDHQQYFTTLSQTTISHYNTPAVTTAPPNQTTLTTASTEPGALMNRPPPGAGMVHKGAMGPPPPPSASGAPSSAMSGTASSTGKSTPVMSRLNPRGMGKDSSSPGGGDGISPERPASRPIPGSTPQATQSTPTPNTAGGTASTPGNAISAPSPGQFTTAQPGQQINRPQSQSPSAAPITRPSTGALNGGPNPSPTPTPTSVLARTYSTPSVVNGPQMSGNSVLASPATNGTIAPASTTFSGAGSVSVGSDVAHDLFNMQLGMPFDNQMMGFQDDVFPMMDFGLGDETYNMFINDSMDPINGA